MPGIRSTTATSVYYRERKYTGAPRKKKQARNSVTATTRQARMKHSRHNLNPINQKMRMPQGHQSHTPAELLKAHTNAQSFCRGNYGTVLCLPSLGGPVRVGHDPLYAYYNHNYNHIIISRGTRLEMPGPGRMCQYRYRYSPAAVGTFPPVLSR